MRFDRCVLAFDTSAAHCAAALLYGDDLHVVKSTPMKKGQAEHLVPLIQEVLALGGKTLADIDLIGVGTRAGMQSHQVEEGGREREEGGRDRGSTL